MKSAGLPYIGGARDGEQHPRHRAPGGSAYRAQVVELDRCVVTVMASTGLSRREVERRVREAVAPRR